MVIPAAASLEARFTNDTGLGTCRLGFTAWGVLVHFSVKTLDLNTLNLSPKPQSLNPKP